MIHFDLALWKDFVDESLPQAEQSRMAGHLREGCAECEAAVDFLRRTELAAQALAVEVPADVVKRAEGLAQAASAGSEEGSRSARPDDRSDQE